MVWVVAIAFGLIGGCSVVFGLMFLDDAMRRDPKPGED
jgi:hypothetical protein